MGRIYLGQERLSAKAGRGLRLVGNGVAVVLVVIGHSFATAGRAMLPYWRQILSACVLLTLISGVIVGGEYEKRHPTVWQVGPGFVRSVNLDGSGYSILFETDQGYMYTFGLCSPERPAVWQGMHGTIYMQNCTLKSVLHLPPDVPPPAPTPAAPATEKK